MARFRAGLATIAVFGALVAPVAFDSVAAQAAGVNRALVIVDTGGQTITREIHFDGTVSGIRALELAGANPVVYTFSGQGGAVCRLYGVGRDAGPNCLGGADGNPNYWAYFRAPAGTATFTYARGGAGSAQVHDGDVEGWRWGTGAAPAWQALPPTTTTTSPPPVPPVGGGTGGGQGSGGGTGPTGSGAAPTAPVFDPHAVAALSEALRNGSTTSTSSTTAPTGTTQVEGSQRTRPDHRKVAAGLPAVAGSDGGGGAGSLLIVGGILAVLAVGGAYLRRSRRRPIP